MNSLNDFEFTLDDLEECQRNLQRMRLRLCGLPATKHWREPVPGWLGAAIFAVTSAELRLTGALKELKTGIEKLTCPACEGDGVDSPPAVDLDPHPCIACEGSGILYDRISENILERLTPK